MANFINLNNGKVLTECELYEFLACGCSRKNYTKFRWKNELTNVNKLGREWWKIWKVTPPSGCSGGRVAPSAESAPSILGNYQTGTTLTRVAGTYSGTAPITLTYEWIDDLDNVLGTGTTYNVVQGDFGRQIKLKETATNAIGSVSQSTTLVTVVSAPVRTANNVVSGNDTVGSVLTSTTGSFDGTATITYGYQWQRESVDIPLATASTYTLVSADADKNIRCIVTATNAYGSDTGTSADNYVFTTQYKAVLTEGTAIGATLPSTAQQKLENRIMVGLVAGGAFGGSATTYWFCSSATTASDSFKSINWMNPTGAKWAISGSPASIDNLGFDFDGVDDAITLPINLSAVGYSITNCSIGVYCPPRFLNNVFTGIGQFMLWGASDGTRQTIFYNAGGTTADWQAIMSNATSRDTNNIKKAEKNYSVEYNGTNVIVRIGSDTHTFAQGAGQTAPSYPLSFGRRNKTTPDSYTKGVLSYMYIGNASAPAMINAVLDSVTPSIFPAEPPLTLQSDWDLNVNAKMWQDVSKTVAVTNGNPVRVVEANAGSGDLVATSDPNRATFGTAVINSLGALNFAGDGDSYALPSTINSEHLLIWVFQNLDNTNGSHIVYGQNYVPVTGTGYVGNPALGGAYFTPHPSGTAAGGVRLKNTAGGFNIIAMKAKLVSGTTFEWTCVNGYLQANKDTKNAPFNWTEIGREYLAGWAMHGPLARLLHYSGVGSDKDLQDLMISLATTYAL